LVVLLQVKVFLAVHKQLLCKMLHREQKGDERSMYKAANLALAAHPK
jgi:hypothetical protein